MGNMGKNQEIIIFFLSRTRYFSILFVPSPGSQAASYRAPIQWIPLALFPLVKWAGNEADHITSSRKKCKTLRLLSDRFDVR
jgi:hypothetical protein